MKDYKYTNVDGTWTQVKKLNGDIEFTTDKEDLVQRIDAALTLKLGEWKYNTSLGQPIFREILTKGFRGVALDHIRKTLKTVKNIKSIESMQIKGVENRQATIEIEIESDFGTITVSNDLA